MTDNKLGEAGGIAWCELYGHKSDEDGVHEVKINLTSRAETPAQALAELLATLKIAREEYKLNPYPVLHKAPALNPVATTVTPVPVAPAPMVNEPVYEDIEQANGEFHAVKMSVTPRTDGKSKVDFFEAGHKYPDISAVMSPEQLASMMQIVGGWTPEHFKQMGTYEVKYAIQWRNSTTLNKNGKPYKNIVGIALE